MLSQYGSCCLTYEVLCLYPPIPAGEAGTDQTDETRDVANETQQPSCKPEIPIPQAHRVDGKLRGVPKSVIGAIWLPYHL